MRVPVSWLCDFIPLDVSTEDLVATLDDLGLAVESVRPVGEGLEGVVVARVLDIGPIPGADRIRAVTVDAGAAPVPVVCGAWNFDVGDLVPLATVGTVLPGGLEIKARRLKGAPSEGMLCAPDELGVAGGHDGILVLGGDAAPGTPVQEALGRGADTVFDLEVNANRPDAMSVAGVARDLAARLGLAFAIPEPKVRDAPAGEGVAVDIEDPEVCGRFVTQVLTGVAVGPSPEWIAERLALAGMRPINNVVDASNYVMLELGQPTHPYDLARLPGRRLRVRRARPGETLVTLDGVTRAVGPDDPLICDADDHALGLAGIMGGASSEIGEQTTSVVLEAAWFDPLTIARSSRQLKLRSEASARFERGCDWRGIDRAVARFCEVLQLSAGDAVAAGAPVEETGHLPDRAPVRLRTERVNQLLGTELSGDRIAGYLAPLGFASTPEEGGVLRVELPSWRLDSTSEIDLVEEVARLHGYRSITSTVPRSPLTGGLDAYQRDRRLVRQVLAGGGADEVWTTTFVSAPALERCRLDPGVAVVVANPLVAEESRLRTSLLPGLLGAVAANARRRQPGVRLFEIGRTFARPSAHDQVLPDEAEMAACAVAGADAREAVTLWHLLVEGLGLAGWRFQAGEIAGLHPTRTAHILIGDAPVGVVGEVDPSVVAAHDIPEQVSWVELDLGRLLSAPHGAASYHPVSRFPSSDIDLAFEVEESIPAAAVERSLRQAGEGLVADVALFDVYRGDQVGAGRRSLAWTVRLQAPDRTLTDDDVAAARSRLVAAVETAHPATLRG